jgi:hypothetical protein
MENFVGKKKVKKWIKKLEQHKNYCKLQALNWKENYKSVDKEIRMLKDGLAKGLKFKKKEK